METTEPTTDYERAVNLLRKAQTKLKSMKLETDASAEYPPAQKGYRQGWNDAIGAMVRELEGIARQ